MKDVLFRRDSAVNATTGTTAPIFVPRGAESQPIKPGEYFFVKVHSSQAAFRGSIFDDVKQLVVSSRVNLHHAALGDEEVFALQRARDVKKDRAEQLGLSQNLISLVPASMSNVTITVEFILDRENRLAALSKLINDNSFLAVVSLAPGAAAVAKTIGSLGQKLIQTFVPAKDHAPILQFSGDFNIGSGPDSLQDGYYVILGSRSERDPIPSPLPALEICPTSIRAGGQDITQLSYVVLEVTRLPVRTRETNAGALWDKKLNEAESLAQEVADNPFADDDMKREMWKKCEALLHEARSLLQADPNYTGTEAAAIYKTVYKKCGDLITGSVPEVGGKPFGFKVDVASQRQKMDIAVDENLDEVAAEYERQVENARRILQDSQVLQPEAVR